MMFVVLNKKSEEVSNRFEAKSLVDAVFRVQTKLTEQGRTATAFNPWPDRGMVIVNIPQHPGYTRRLYVKEVK